MALLDLSLVTKSLIQLIQTYVEASTAWKGVNLKVSPQPADMLSGQNTLGFYLYHVSEDAHFMNLPPPGSDQPPIRYTPMGLNLYYQLTAHSDQEGETGPYQEQLMLGLAVKALHDYPIIDDSAQIINKSGNTIAILEKDIAGKGNHLRITLQPVPQDHAVSYWTAGSRPLRLAAYYQVSVVLLEPEEPTLRAGRVLAYGVHTFVTGAPRLDGSKNVVPFTLPSETEPREVELRPAQAPPAPPMPAPTPSASKVTFVGSGLAGHHTSLLLRNLRWTGPIEVGAPWNVAAREDQVTTVVQETAGTQDILPGIYAAQVKVVTRRAMPGGKVREFEHTSNETPFVVTPRIDTHTAPSPTGVVTVTGHIFEHADLGAKDLQVYVGDQRLSAGTLAGLNPGEFAVVDKGTLRLRLPAGLPAGEFVPLRLLINGAESPPRWVKV